MGWADLLDAGGEVVVVPWTGGRSIRSGDRTFKVDGRLPREHGWHEFEVSGGRKAVWKGACDNAQPAVVCEDLTCMSGYLAGDRLIPDSVSASTEARDAPFVSETVWLCDRGLDRFTRIRAARWPDGRLIFVSQEFPLGPEFDVVNAFEARKASVSDVPQVTPALDLAFRYETWLRDEAAKERAERERLAREEAARLEAEERRAALFKQIGDGTARRELARVDFEAAARAALKVSDAELLDWKDAFTAGQAVVTFRFKNRRFECVADKATLRIVDSGICLVDHGTGEKGDTRFTLESLPTVIAQAMRERKLVVFRHADGEDVDDPDTYDSE